MKSNKKLAQYPKIVPLYKPPNRSLIKEKKPTLPSYKTPTAKQANQSITKELRKIL